MSDTHYRFFADNSLAFTLTSDCFVKSQFLKSLHYSEIKNILVVNCGNKTTRNKTVRHKKRFSASALFCTNCPSFSTTSQVDLNHHIAWKHPKKWAENTYKWKIWLEEFSGFYALRKHRSSQHGIPVSTFNIVMDTLSEETDDAEPKEEPNSCNQILVDSELEKGRHSEFKFTMSSFKNSFLNEKLYHVFSHMKRAAKVNVVFGFVLKNLEDGTCR